MYTTRSVGKVSSAEWFVRMLMSSQFERPIMFITLTYLLTYLFSVVVVNWGHQLPAISRISFQ